MSKILNISEKKKVFQISPKFTNREIDENSSSPENIEKSNREINENNSSLGDSEKTNREINEKSSTPENNRKSNREIIEKSSSSERSEKSRSNEEMLYSSPLKASRSFSNSSANISKSEQKSFQQSEYEPSRDNESIKYEEFLSESEVGSRIDTIIIPNGVNLSGLIEKHEKIKEIILENEIKEKEKNDYVENKSQSSSHSSVKIPSIQYYDLSFMNKEDSKLVSIDEEIFENKSLEKIEKNYNNNFFYSQRLAFEYNSKLNMYNNQIIPILSSPESTNQESLKPNILNNNNLSSFKDKNGKSAKDSQIIIKKKIERKKDDSDSSSNNSGMF